MRLELLWIPVAAAASAPPCSLNGDLVAGKCACDPAWKGDACAQLDIEPQPQGYVPAYGFQPNVTSWGGSAIKGDDGLFHLLVSEIPGGLAAWNHESRIIHAVAEDPMQVFKKVGTPLPKYAHNAAPVRAPRTHAACPGCWYLFHIGASNSTSGFAHRSTSPYGPWQPVPAPFGCNNPGPAFAKRNGTLFVVCNSLTVYQAGEDPMDRKAWVKLSSLDVKPWVDGHYTQVEDAFLWEGTRGWHMLSHRYDYRDGDRSAGPVLVAGLAFSEDLRTWHLSLEVPFGNAVVSEDGKVQNFSTLERPHLIFDEEGAPTHVVHAASPVWAQYGAPCNVCAARPGTKHSCVVCKTTKGYDWTYTMVRKLRRPRVSTITV